MRWTLRSSVFVPPEKHISLLRQSYGPIVVTRDGGDLPSRVAENLYWLGRYGERLDSTMRLLRETLGRLREQEQENSEESCLDDLLRALGWLSTASTSDSSQTRFYAIRKQLLRLLTDLDFIDSLSAIFARMLRNGRAVRNHRGDDSWRLLNRLQSRIQRVPIDLTAREAGELLEGHLTLLTAFSGLNNETMPHHHGWLFLDIGRYLEHAWLAVYLPGQGWAEFDPTNNCTPHTQHITLAWGRDYSDAPPLKGVMSGGGAHTLEVAVDVIAQE